MAEVLKALGEEGSDNAAKPIVSVVETLSIADAAANVSLPSAPQTEVIVEDIPITEVEEGDSQPQIQLQLPTNHIDLTVEVVEPDPFTLVPINAEGIADTEGGTLPSPILNLVGVPCPPVEDIPGESKAYFPRSLILLSLYSMFNFIV